MSRVSLIKRDVFGIAVRQGRVNGFDVSYNPDDGRFYICDWNRWGELETRKTFLGNEKGWHNARRWCRVNIPNNPQE